MERRKNIGTAINTKRHARHDKRVINEISSNFQFNKVFGLANLWFYEQVEKYFGITN